MLAIMSVAALAARLPEIPTLKRWSQSLAVLDLVLNPTSDERYFAFDANWGESEQVASMSNGSGDEYSIVFGPAGAFVRGFDHESQLSPWAFEPVAVVAGLVDGVPPALRDQVGEPAFTLDGVPSLTVCLWRQPHDTAWCSPPPPILNSSLGMAARVGCSRA